MAKVKCTLNGKTLAWPAKSWPGIPVPIWKAKAKFIREFVAKNGLSAAKFELKVDNKILSSVPSWWKHGGYPLPHLHLGDDIYIVSKTQWAEAVAGLVKGTGIKLEEAKSIEFGSLMQKFAEADLAKRAGQQA
jgi:hypothetical protein